MYRDDICPTIVAETMLLSHEARLDWANRTPIIEPLQWILLKVTPQLQQTLIQHFLKKTGLKLLVISPNNNSMELVALIEVD